MQEISVAQDQIGKILKDRDNLRVPSNQREYKWEEENVKALYEDIELAMNDNAPEYFIGSIVVVGSDNEEFEVFDGQQRIATTMILIAAIRDFLWKLNPAKAEKNTAKFLWHEDPLTEEQRPKFTLSPADQDYFLNGILKNPDDADRQGTKLNTGKQSNKRLKTACDVARNHVRRLCEGTDEDGQWRNLLTLIEYIQKRLKVIWIQVGDQGTAFRIFETMNDRGLKLSSADLLKNHLYFTAGKRRADVERKWTSMAKSLEHLGESNGDIVDFIRYYWIAHNGKIRSSELYDKLKKTVKTETSAVQLATKLELWADRYVAILTPTHPHWIGQDPQTPSLLEELLILNVSQLRPILLAAYDSFPAKEYAKLVRSCINWTVRTLVAGVPSGSLELPYANSARRITDKGAPDQIKNVKELTAAMRPYIPDDVTFKAAFATKRESKSKIARYILRTLQMTEDKKSESVLIPNSDPRTLNLEHILPKGPKKGWEHISKDDADSGLERLGNLALIFGKDNSKIGNFSYEEKKPALQNCELSLTKQAATYSIWDLSAIEDRQAKLAEIAVKAWPLTVK